MSVRRSTISLLSSTVVGSVMMFIALAYFARALGGGPLGSFFLFQALVITVAKVSNFGMHGALEKRLSEGMDQGEIFSTAILAKAVMLLLISGFVWLAGEAVNSFVGAEIVSLLIACIVFKDFSDLFIKGALRGRFKVAITGPLSVFKHIIFITSAVLLHLYSGIENPLYIAITVSYIASTIAPLFFIDIPLRRPRRKLLRSIIDYAKFNSISSFSWHVYGWMDVLILGIFVMKVDVGAYEMAWRVTAFIMLFSNSIATAIFPKLSQLSAKQQWETIEEFIELAVSIGLLITIPALAGSIILSESILTTAFGPEFGIASLALVILMVDRNFQSVNKIFVQTLNACNRPNLTARSSLVAIFVNVTLNVVLIYQFGITGAAVATLLATTFSTLLNFYFIRSELELSIGRVTVRPSIVATVVMFGIVVFLREQFPLNDLATLGAIILIGAFVYGLVLVPHRGFRDLVRRAMGVTGY